MMFSLESENSLKVLEEKKSIMVIVRGLFSFIKIHSLSLCENSFYVVGIGGLPQIPPARPSKAGGFSIFAWFSLVKEWRTVGHYDRAL